MSMIGSGGFSRIPARLGRAANQATKGPYKTQKANYSGFKPVSEASQERIKELQKKIESSGISKDELTTIHLATKKQLDPLFSDKKSQKTDAFAKGKMDVRGSSNVKNNAVDFERVKTFVGEESVSIHFKKIDPAELRHIQSAMNAQVSNQETANDRLREMLSTSSTKETAKPLIPASEDLDLNQIRDENNLAVSRHKDFKKDISDTLAKGLKKSEKWDHLEKFIYNDDGKGLNRFNAQELKTLLMELWNLEAYDLIVEMIENSTNKEFVQNPVNLEFYAKSIMKGYYFNTANVRAVAFHLESTNPVEAYTLLTVIEAISKKAAKEVYILNYTHNNFEEIQISELPQKDQDKIALYEKCFLDAEIDNSTEVYENYEGSLSLSLMFSEEAFKHSCDCRLACRALHRSLEQMNEPEIERWVILTKLSALKEGGLRSNNVSVVRSYLEALYASSPPDDKEIYFAEETLINLFEHDHQITDFISSLNDLILPNQNSAIVDEFKKRLETTMQEIQSNNPGRTKQRKENILKLRSEWDSYTYTYKGVNSNYVEGNFRFGAQLPTHHINRHDRSFFQEILEQPISSFLNDLNGISDPQKKLEDIIDFEEFNQIVDKFIRQRFHTDDMNLEQLDSDGHKVFDKTVQGLNALYGGSTKEARKNMPDSKTNISTNFVLGLGDCRHHSQVKQILFDKWRAHHVDKMITEIYQLESLEGDGKVKCEALKAECQELLRHELRTFDLEVYLPVKLENGYPVWKDGHLVKDPSNKVNKVEEHTLTVEVNYDESMAKVEEATLRDAFYQKTYPWAAQSVGDPDKLLKEGVSGGSIEVLDVATGKLETVNITLRPTNYAGPKERYDRGADEAYCIGQPIEKMNFKDAKQMDAEIEAHKNRVREWHNLGTVQ